LLKKLRSVGNYRQNGFEFSSTSNFKELNIPELSSYSVILNYSVNIVTSLCKYYISLKNRATRQHNDIDTVVKNYAELSQA